MGPLACWPRARVHSSAMSRLPTPHVYTFSSLLLFSAVLGACASDDPVKDQASGTIDKSPGKWSEPGAMAEPPVARELDAGSDAATDAATCDASISLSPGASACVFTLVDAPDPADEALFEVALDGDALSRSGLNGFGITGETLTLVGAPCAAVSGVDAGTDAGQDGGTDAATHTLQVRYGTCVNAE